MNDQASLDSLTSIVTMWITTTANGRFAIDYGSPINPANRCQGRGTSEEIYTSCITRR